MNCVVCNSNEVVMSGVDAFVLGVITEKFCYDCSNKYNKVKSVLESVVM